ncbi:MAG: excisionase family DNA-binding protein [Treponema sp.]|nr:excisionase family DNA-binding protein [Treponema sp.]
MTNDFLKEKIEKLPAILSIREAASFFSAHHRTVLRLIRKGQLPAWKDDEGNWCVARSDLIKFCSKNTNLYFN